MDPRLFFCAPFLALLAAEDLRQRRAPNGIVVCGAAAGILWHFLTGRGDELWTRLAAAALAGLFGSLFRQRGLGAGDVKTVMMTALWFPAETLLRGMLWGLLAALPPTLLAPAEEERKGRRLTDRLRRKLPLIPFLTAGLAGEWLRVNAFG